MKQETNKLKRCWIWFWYNDITRLSFVVFGGHLILTIPVFYWLFGTDFIQEFAMITYLLLLGVAFLDNDYSNLRRIGLDEYRKPLKKYYD